MTSINTNGTLTLDQTFGPQTGGDGDDVEVTLDGRNLDGLQTAFRDFLAALSDTFLTEDGLNYADDAEAATTSGTGPFVTVDPGEADINALFFSDGAGGMLDGDQVFLNDGVTAMTTIDGDSIYLHSYTDGQIVLGTTSATKDAGEVVVAFYLDTAVDLLSAEVTMVTFIAINHPDSGDQDDSVDFGDILNVSATGSLSFDFDGLDSGNFLHVSVGDSTAGLLVSGRNLSVDTDGEIIKGGTDPSDTVNTSQGGQGSTIGINSQMFRHRLVRRIQPGRGAGCRHQH